MPAALQFVRGDDALVEERAVNGVFGVLVKANWNADLGGNVK